MGKTSKCAQCALTSPSNFFSNGASTFDGGFLFCTITNSADKCDFARIHGGDAMAYPRHNCHIVRDEQEGQAEALLEVQYEVDD